MIKEPGCRKHKRRRFKPWIGKIPWRVWQPTPVFLPREFHGQRSLVGYSAWGFNESNTTEQLSFLLHLLREVMEGFLEAVAFEVRSEG